jgi:hypothetical protein
MEFPGYKYLPDPLSFHHQQITTSSHCSARAERFELPSTVLETAILPLNYARVKSKVKIQKYFRANPVGLLNFYLIFN